MAPARQSEDSPVQLKPGTRYQSVTCTTEVVVVKGAGEVDLRCGGSPLVPVGEGGAAGAPVAPFAEGTLLGKRYTDADETVELLCTKPGDGSLSVGDDALAVKGAKPLPSSD
jgi:hypothetical protein